MCEEQKCQDEVFSLAVNYMDRFLMCCSIMKNQLQLLGTVCMLLASKLRESKPLAGETLVYYTDHSVTKEQLWVSELNLSLDDQGKRIIKKSILYYYIKSIRLFLRIIYYFPCWHHKIVICKQIIFVT